MTRIGFFQFQPQQHSVQENIDFIVHSLVDVKDCLIVLPELFLHNYTTVDVLQENQLKHILAKLLAFSEKNKIAFIGSLPIIHKGIARNRSYYINDGIITKIGDKKRLYDEEKKRFVEGKSKNKVVQYKEISFSACVCLDVLDHQLVHQMMSDGADLLCVSATVSVDFLRKTTQVRSFENQMFAVFSNRSGLGQRGITYLGKSAIFFPNGKEVTAKNQKSSLEIIEITNDDLLNIQKMRKMLGII